jgi:hypothetical protein
MNIKKDKPLDDLAVYMIGQWEEQLSQLMTVSFIQEQSMAYGEHIMNHFSAFIDTSSSVGVVDQDVVEDEYLFGELQHHVR